MKNYFSSILFNWGLPREIFLSYFTVAYLTGATSAADWINTRLAMSQIRPLIFTGLHHLRLFELLRNLQKNRVIILMYHRFSDKAEPFKIQQTIFENQIKFLMRQYNFISLKQYADILNREKADYPKNAIILTIDDGYSDSYTFAYPILNKYSIPATTFLTTDFINHKAWLWSDKLAYILMNSKRQNFEFAFDGKSVQFRVDNFKNWHKTQLAIFNYCRTIGNDEKNGVLNELAKHLKVTVPDKTVGDFQPVTWQQIKEMQFNGIDFGSHTCSHPILARASSRELRHQIFDSKKEIECKLEVEITSFSYPNGQLEDINDSVIEMTQRAGYSCAVTTIRGFNNVRNTERFLLKRLSVLTDNEIVLSKELAQPF